MKRTYDITTNGNMIGGRQGWAYICNSGEVKVLEADFDKDRGYKNYSTFGKAKLEGRNGLGMVCKLFLDTSNDAEWGFANGGIGISSSFTYNDALELARNAQLVKIKEGDIVAIAKHRGNMIALELFKLSRVDIHCTTAATLKPLTEEEMIEVGRSATRWLER